MGCLLDYLDLSTYVPAKERRQGVATCNIALNLSRELLHNCHTTHIKWVICAIAGPDLDQLPQLPVSGMTPVCLHREVSKLLQWVDCELKVHGSQFDRSDATLITACDRMILVVAGKEVQSHVPIIS